MLSISFKTKYTYDMIHEMRQKYTCAKNRDRLNVAYNQFSLWPKSFHSDRRNWNSSVLTWNQVCLSIFQAEIHAIE